MSREPVEPTKRRAMTRKRRAEVALKSGGRCARCDEKLKPDFEADHILSLFLGGADEIENLEALCYDCHRRIKTPLDAAKHGKVRRLIKKEDPETRKAPRMRSANRWPAKGSVKLKSRGFGKPERERK